MDILSEFICELHDTFGVCGHCGKRKCPQHNSQSILPYSISKALQHVEQRLRTESEALWVEAFVEAWLRATPAMGIHHIQRPAVEAEARRRWKDRGRK
jgi:hypothetical protein